jgi:hypothetical protein
MSAEIKPYRISIGDASSTNTSRGYATRDGPEAELELGRAELDRGDVRGRWRISRITPMDSRYS